MTTKLHRGVLSACIAIIVIGFFLPWVHVGSSQVGAVSKLLTGTRQENITNISGVQIPILANSDESKLMITIIKIFNPGIKDADKKSWGVFGIIVLGFLIYALIYYFPKNKWIHLAIGLLGVAIFTVAVFKIATTDMDKFVIQVKIGIGMWMILAAYLVIGIMSFIQFGRQLKGK